MENNQMNFIKIITPCTKVIIGIMLFSLLLYSPVESSMVFVGIKPLSISPDFKNYSEIHQLLFKRLHSEILPRGLMPLLLTTDQAPPDSCEAVISGNIDSSENGPTYHFRLQNIHDGSEETKIIPLNGRDAEDIVEILTLTARRFLEQTISGRLRISSTPMDCNVLLNGIRIGTTPAELVLEHGKYRVRLERDNLIPFTDTVEVIPGKDVFLNATMRFKGYNSKPWFIGASLLSIVTTGLWITENRFHQDYQSLKQGTSQSKFDASYNRYRTTDYLRIGFLNGAVLSWTVTGYLFAKNRSLKNHIFGSTSEN